MHFTPPSLTTDQQRLARAGRLLLVPSSTIPSDQAWLSRPQLPNPALPAPRRPTVPRPLIVVTNTWSIRGKDGTYLGFAFGDGRQSHEINLYDHLPANRVPHLGNYVFDMTGIIPVAIGLDIGGTGGIGPVSVAGGLNIIWHTRGEANGDRFYPELHVYHGYSGGFTANAIVESATQGANATAAVQLILGWAVDYDDKGVSRPAPSRWIANGFNWTGYFYNLGVSIPVGGKYSLVGSYFQSVPYGSVKKSVTVWKGISVGVGVSGKFSVKMPFFKFDMAELFSLKKFTRAGSFSRTEFGLVYGNGGDFIPQRKDQNIGGWHTLPGVNQNNY